MQNIILLTDSYKTSHYRQYPLGTRNVYSYFESRGTKIDGVKEVVFFGLQHYLKNYLEGQVVTEEFIQQAKTVVDAHMGPGVFNEAGWRHILEQHDGRLPVRIKAVPEGTPVTLKNVLMTVEVTDPEVYWLSNYLETLLVQVWYGCTVATISRECKRIILQYLKETSDDLSGAAFKLHDFGFRGASSIETAAVGGAAHLVNFMGTDTVVALVEAQFVYHASSIAGFSIPAAEHSTITSWGRENEIDAFRNMLKQYPSGLVAVVSDSYNIYEACADKWGKHLKAEVLGRNGTLVVRPDSGNPSEVVVQCLNLLWDAFGGTINSKGYKVLDPHVRLIQGDGINIRSLEGILQAVKMAGFSTDNLAFGMGAGLLQQCDRDTFKFAFKCSAIDIDGEWHEVYKDPVTDQGKISKKGRLTLIRNKDDGSFATFREEGADFTNESFFDYEEAFVTVFENGKVLVEYDFDSIRARAKLE